mgnify:CR=1 FL=1
MSAANVSWQYLPEAPQVRAALAALPRTGWVQHGVTNPETVLEHTEALLRLGAELLPELTATEQDGLLAMLEVHDWPEAVVGDEVILELEPDRRQPLKDAKLERERQALL